MSAHYEDTAHDIAYSMRDSSVWCYSCDSYIDTLLTRPWVVHMARCRFGADSEAAADTAQWAETPLVPHAGWFTWILDFGRLVSLTYVFTSFYFDRFLLL